MNSKERILTSLSHKQPDRVAIDLGASPVSGMQVSTVYQVRQYLGLDKPGTPVKVIEPYQMLGEISEDLMEALGVDAIGLWGRTNMFGFENTDWKEWETFDGTPVLVPGLFNTEQDGNGDILQYPEGDREAGPSARMPDGGFYFDAIVRQDPIDDANLDVEDNLQEFGPMSETDIKWFKTGAEKLKDSDKGVLGSFGGTAFGDIALVPAMHLKKPKGIRDIEEWYISTMIRKDYVYSVFEKQCETALKNLVTAFEAVGNSIDVVFITGTDFGMQNGPFISLDTYKELYHPFLKQVHDWVHEHTQWKTFMHSCGSVLPLIPGFIESGVDILNPVQWSADNMDPGKLKSEFGKDLTFWGGGIDTQHTLPFKPAEEVKEEAKRTLDIFAKDGGYVFNSIHNIQANIPPENVVALFEAAKEF